MNELINKINELIYLDVILAIIFSTYIAIKLILPNNISQRMKIFTTLIIAFCYSVLFYHFAKYEIVRLLISSLLSVSAYDYILKPLLKKLQLHYTENDPELIK
jgi:hypothetical protein